jgi:predicted phosphodiesterase
MRLALLSDVHGNPVALGAVIRDARSCDVDGWWVLGDLAAIGPDPVSTVAMLADLPDARFVRGNTDRYTVTGERPPPTPADVERDPSLRPLFDEVEAAFSWTRDTLANAGTGWHEWLLELPREQRCVLPDGTRVLAVHASVRSDEGPGIAPDVPDDVLAQLLAGADADIVLGGHTHQATDRRVDGVRAINLGSVSNPMTSDLRASYVILHADRHGHEVEHRRVAYDHDAVVGLVEHSGHPAAAYIAGLQRGVNPHRK